MSKYTLHNPSTFKALFNGLYKDLVLYANGYLFDKAESEDVVQEVFVQLWEMGECMEIKTSLKAYVYRMVRNKSLNLLRSKKITDNSRFLEIGLLVVDEDSTPQIDIQDGKQLVLNKALQVVDALPDKMQEIFKLKFLHNYKYKEIAEELEISVNTVKIQLKRAKQKISHIIA